MESKKIKLTKEQYSRLFGKKPLNESIEYKELHGAILSLIKALYNNDLDLQKSLDSQVWIKNNTNSKEIRNFLCGIGLLIQNKEGGYTIPKKYKDNLFDKPEKAVEYIEKALTQYFKNNFDSTKKELETEAIGSNTDQLDIVAINDEIAIFKNKTNDLFVLYHGDLDNNALSDVADREKVMVGRDEEGDPDFEYTSEIEKNSELLDKYVNANYNTLSKGEGVNDFEQGKQLVKIDDSLKNELLALYDKDKTIVNSLSTIQEVEGKSQDDAISSFKKDIKANFSQEKSTKTPEQIKIALAKLKNKELERRKAESDIEETTSAASSGSFSAPLFGDSSVIKKEPVIDEVTVAGSSATGGSSGPYDANAFPNIGRNGEFKKGVIKKQKPFYRGGKQVNQEKIFEALAKTTGKTIEEIRNIVNNSSNCSL